MTAPAITLDEVLAELERLQRASAAQHDVEGFTYREFAAKYGKGETATREAMRVLHEQGRLVCAGKRRTQGVAGQVKYEPIYQLVRG